MDLSEQWGFVWSSIILLLSDTISFLWRFTLFLYYLRKEKKIVSRISNDILLKSARELGAKIRSGELTSSEIVKAYVERLREVNSLLNAVADDYTDDALNKAKEIDEQIKNSSEEEKKKLFDEKPLLGIPFTCKDLYDIKGTKTTWGTWKLKENVSESTHIVIQMMLDAGGIPFVKTTVPEGCVFIESVNPIQGITNNPYDSRRNAGGSSGGEGALIGAGASIIGLGSDLGGSIRVPAALNGVYGLKPSVGTFPIVDLVGNPVEPLWNCFGPLCRYVDDIELLLNIFCHGDRAKHVKEANEYPVEKIFIPTDTPTPWMPRVKQENQAATLKVAEFLCEEYASSCIDSIDLSPIKSQYVDIYIANYDEFPIKQKNLEGLKSRMLAAGNKSFHALTELPKWIFGKSKHYLAAIVLFHFFKRSYTLEQREKYLKLLPELKARYDKILSNTNFIVQSGWPHCAEFHHTEVATPSLAHTAIYNLLDLPVIMCPVGMNEEGLPLSVSIIGPRGSEYKLVEIARKIDKKFGGWVAPGNENL
ncbi:unnamed protein product, partial [Mesorhabditis belari]|uniref:Amidase domain-containing protein n=1 Tax=Mesorhabditis belari TaxID=2138241 RepID=A0AAF3E973_9BILA